MWGLRSLAMAACLACVAGGASAQVYRCVDAAGKQTFSDAPCAATSQSGRQVLGAGATQRLSSEEEEAASQRTLHSIERARALKQGTVNASIQQERPAGAAAGRSSRVEAPVDEMACQAAQRDVEMASATLRTEVSRGNNAGTQRVAVANAQKRMRSACGQDPRRGMAGGSGPRGTLQGVGAGASAGPEAPRITHCNASFCYDDQGGVYQRQGDSSTMTAPNGTACTQASSHMRC